MHLFGIGIVGVLLFALWLFCIIDVITTAESDMQHLPKILWLLIVIFLPTVGSIVWLVVGRPRSLIAGTRAPRAQQPPHASRFPEYDRPGRRVAQNPDDDEAFLRQLRERAEQQRREAKRKQEEKKEGPDEG